MNSHELSERNEKNKYYRKVNTRNLDAQYFICSNRSQDFPLQEPVIFLMKALPVFFFLTVFPIKKIAF